MRTQSVLLSAAFFAAAPAHAGELMGDRTAYNRAYASVGFPITDNYAIDEGSLKLRWTIEDAGQIANLRSAAAPTVQFRLVESVNLNGSGAAELSCIDFAEEFATITLTASIYGPDCGTADDEHSSITVPAFVHTGNGYLVAEIADLIDEVEADLSGPMQELTIDVQTQMAAEVSYGEDTHGPDTANAKCSNSSLTNRLSGV